jgi:hypothetical protein
MIDRLVGSLASVELDEDGSWDSDRHVAGMCASHGGSDELMALDTLLRAGEC